MMLGPLLYIFPVAGLLYVGWILWVFLKLTPNKKEAPTAWEEFVQNRNEAEGFPTSEPNGDNQYETQRVITSAAKSETKRQPSHPNWNNSNRRRFSVVEAMTSSDSQDSVDIRFIPKINLTHPIQTGRQPSKVEPPRGQSAKGSQRTKLKNKLKVKYVKRYRDSPSERLAVEESKKSTSGKKTKNKPNKKEVYSSMWKEVDAISHQSVKASSRVESERVYNEIIKKHNLLLACRECVIARSDETEIEEHICKQNRVLLRGNTSGWQQVLNIPKGYKPSNVLCDLKQKCERRSRCKYPHSSEECDLWKILCENKSSLDVLVEDIRRTDLQLKYAVGHISEDIKVLVVCRNCYKKKNYDRFLKAKKKPFCRNSHPWKGNQILIVELLGEPNENKRYLQITKALNSSSLDVSDDTKHSVRNLQLLLVEKYSLDDIAMASHQFQQRKHVGSSKNKDKKKKKNNFRTEADSEEDNAGSDEYDDYMDDILQEVNVDSSKVELSFRREAIESSSKDRIYYELVPYEDLDALLDSTKNKPDTQLKEDSSKNNPDILPEENSPVYKLCKIKLDGSQKAVCTALDDGEKIEIRGRQNCGPTANGDIVVVEIKKEEVLDADWKQKEGAEDAELHMIRGVVVGIKSQNCNRKSYNFVCTVDEYFAHLMMPICGTIPKINCNNRPIKNHPDKNSKVCIFQDKGKCTRTVSVNRKNIHDKLFVVRYEEWGITHMYSRGYVVKVIQPGLTLENGQRVLNLMYQVPPGYSTYVNELLDIKYADGIPQHLMENRDDFADLNVFSIDPPGCQDVDDALSVTQNGESHSKEIYEVGIHIADVTAFLTKDEELDKKAAIRKTSFYPQHGPPQHMLPDKLSRYLCSLQQGERRLTISVFIQMAKSGKLVGKPRFHRGIIQNRKQLTYTEAEKMISDDTDLQGSQDISKDVRTLHMLAKGLRKERIGRQSFSKETQISYDRNHEMSEEAHLLVEELMILANGLVAKHLVKELPERTLVRSQPAPSKNTLISWMQGNEVVAHCGFLFQDLTAELTNHAENDNFNRGQTLNILHSTFEMLSRKGEQDMHKLEKIIAMEKMHPTLAVGFSGWLDIQTRASVHKYEEDVTSRHFSLKKNYYTWFTSPIRRYMDIIIHRLLLYTMDQNQVKEIPYTAGEIQHFSTEFNNATQRSRQHSRASSVLRMATSLKSHTAVVPAFVGTFNEDGVTFELPYLPQIKKRNRNVNYSLFGICDKPNTQDKHFTLLWQKRLYSTLVNEEYARLQSAVSTPGFVTKLNHEKHVRKVLVEKWLELQDLLVQQDLSELPFAIQRMIDDSIPRNFQDGLFDDVTSEMKHSQPIIKHHAKFSLTVETGNALPVQLGTTAEKGMLVTAVNLIGLSKTIDICTEHASDPVKCFADIATTPSKQRYRDISEYKNIWLPILEMEAATNAVSDGDPVTIHNVPVKISPINDRYDGYIELREDFCSHRHVKFLSTKKLKGEQLQDYLCMRFPGQDNWSALPHMSEPFLTNHFLPHSVWVAHAQAVYATIKGDDGGDRVRVEFTVNQHCAPPSKEVKFGKLQNCTVEFIPKTLPDRRMKDAVENLNEANDISKAIILGKPLTEVDVANESDSVPRVVDICVKKANHPLPLNNSAQIEAIEHALKHSFTMIQGPPGTGKTLTGVKLVYWFNEMNKNIPSGTSKRQIMYCGPSNSAVDVATKQLMYRLAEKCPKIVRVYSEMLENQVFPIPRDYVVSNVRGRKYQLIAKRDQENIALHYLIRKGSNTYSGKILGYDRMFSRKPAHKISDEEVEKYQKVVTDASIEELKKYDVILCTCSVSASPRIKRATNIQQLIIDESGMCMEPEVIVPLVAINPQQIVLIGDHKQLRPIVKNQTAKELGLDKSLFERYAQIYKPIMLDQQYRMHKEICAFPSYHFYDDRLKTVLTSYWDGQPMSIWPNKKIPVVFCHVKGEEKSLSVATEDGNEQSKSNEAERFHVRRIFMDLIHKLGVAHEHIAVLSQYKAQCKKIENDLKGMGYDKAKVCTVVASQGDEWDYVILSTVRSMPQYEIEKRPSTGWLKRNLGFITDHNQINVALTRARRGLIIVGNKHLLQCDNDRETGLWGKLLKFYNTRGCVVDATLFPVRPDERCRLEEQYTNTNWTEVLPPRLRRTAQRQY